MENDTIIDQTAMGCLQIKAALFSVQLTRLPLWVRHQPSVLFPLLSPWPLSVTTLTKRERHNSHGIAEILSPEKALLECPGWGTVQTFRRVLYQSGGLSIWPFVYYLIIDKSVRLASENGISPLVQSWTSQRPKKHRLLTFQFLFCCKYFVT